MMPKTKITIRILMLLAYFLPFHFLSCTSFQFAYNREEAKELSATEETEDTARNNAVAVKADSVSYSGLTPPPAQRVIDTPTTKAPALLELIVFPVEEATSGIGALFYYKSPAGKIMVGFGLSTTLILLVGAQWLKIKRGLTIGLFSTGILSLLLFIGISYSDQVQLLWGVWVALALSLIGLVLELPTKSGSFVTTKKA